MPRHSAMPELGSTPQLVPVAEAPAVAPAPEPPETPALPAEPESGALPTCRQDDSRMASNIEITSRIAGILGTVAKAGQVIRTRVADG